MIKLITGAPGNGKTLMAMFLMNEEYERNAAAVKAGKEQPRRFFSNVKGATTDENPEAFPWVELLPPGADWTKLPDGAYVQYDEAHSDGKTPGLERYGHLFPSTGKPGESDDVRIRAMSTHRHRGFDLVLITQWPSKIHHQARTLVGEHVHMSRAFGLAKAGVIRWNRVQSDPYDEQQREKAEETIWAYPKDLYKRYLSASLHTASHKFKMPSAIWKGLSMLVMFGAIIAVFLWWVQGNTDEKVAEASELAGPKVQGQERAAPAAPARGGSAQEVSRLPGTGLYASLNTEPLPRIAGYIDSPRGCRIWNAEGLQLDITQSECKRLVAQGIPVSFAQDNRRANRRDREDEDRSVGEPLKPSGPAPVEGDVLQASYGSMRGKEWPAGENTQSMF